MIIKTAIQYFIYMLEFYVSKAWLFSVKVEKLFAKLIEQAFLFIMSSAQISLWYHYIRLLITLSG